MFIHVSDSKQNTISECDSFYDYVCNADTYSSVSESSIYRQYDHHYARTPATHSNKEENEKPSSASVNSYFKWIQEANDKLIKAVLNKLALPYKVCMEEFDRSIRIETTTGKDISYEDIVIETSNNIKQEGLGSLYPITIRPVKKLDELKECIELSPNDAWIAKVYNILDNLVIDATLHQLHHNNKKDIEKWSILKKFFQNATDMYNKTSYSIVHDYNKGIEADDKALLINYIKQYKTIEQAGNDGSLSLFWKDVIYQLYPSMMEDNDCIQLNQYSDFYDIIENYALSQFTHKDENQIDVTYNFVDIITTTSYDLAFNRFRKPSRQGIRKEQKEIQCEGLLKEGTPIYFNTLFLREAGFDVNNNNNNNGNSDIVEMITEVKNRISDHIMNSQHVPFGFKRFAINKLKTMNIFVLTVPMSEPGSLSNEMKCVQGNFTSWDEYRRCLAMVKFDRLNNKNQSRYDMIFASTDTSIVNAWYDPTRNEITVPAGIIAWPIYTGASIKEGLDPYDFARMGMIIGHELGHSLDTNGICWDHQGSYLGYNNHNGGGDDQINKKIEDEDEMNFCSESRTPYMVKYSTRCLKEDYGHPCETKDNYGENTIGEDIADQLGIITAYGAFVNLFGEENIRLEDRRDFFRKYAMLWCDGHHPSTKHAVKKEINTPVNVLLYNRVIDRHRTLQKWYNTKHNEEEGKEDDYKSWVCSRVKTDVHALPKHRVNKTLRQFVEFVKVFGCTKVDNMYKENPCLIY